VAKVQMTRLLVDASGNLADKDAIGTPIADYHFSQHKSAKVPHDEVIT
jgi:hypothetical protein